MANTVQDQLNARRIWDVCDIMRQSDYAGPRDYIADIAWLLFLRLLDAREMREERRYEALRQRYSPTLKAPHRWRDWGHPDGRMRRAFADGSVSPVDWVNEDLLLKLKGIGARRGASPSQRLISVIVDPVSTIGIRHDKQLLDILDLLDDVAEFDQDTGEQFALSHAFEELLLKMGESKSDRGQFFTPRTIVRALVEAVKPVVGETVYDPCCGTGGFLAQAFEYMKDTFPITATAADLNQLGSNSLFGREYARQVHQICVGNLALHGIDQPRIWHGDTLRNDEIDRTLFGDAPDQFDVVLTNPPFSAVFDPSLGSVYDYESKDTQLLFLQEVMNRLKPEGRAGMVVDEGLLYKNTESHIGVRRRLLDDFDIQAIVSLATGSFWGAGTGVRTNLLIFEQGRPTEKIWYYDISPPPGAHGASETSGLWAFTKQYPLRPQHFEEFLHLLPTRGESLRSWTVDRADIPTDTLDLKQPNPHPPVIEISKTPEELLAEIEVHGRELEAALAELRKALAEE